MECDKADGIEKPTPSRFFPKEASCIAIYELMETRRKWDGTVICCPALMNAIWKYMPEYAMSLNGQKPQRPNSVLLNLLEDAGLKIMPRSDGKHVVGMFPEAGVDFLLLQ